MRYICTVDIDCDDTAILRIRDRGLCTKSYCHKHFIESKGRGMFFKDTQAKLMGG